MLYFDIHHYYDSLYELFEEEKQLEFQEIFDSLSFKLNKNTYHYENLSKLIEQSRLFTTENFYQNVHVPMYYEIEDLLISLRSSVDMILHLVNFCFDLGLRNTEVTIGNIIRHPNLPKALKTVFQNYTRINKDNIIWTFIYSSRNLIVHEKSINQVLPIQIDVLSPDEVLVFFEWEGVQKEIITFLKQTLRFLETFSSQTFKAIQLSL